MLKGWLSRFFTVRASICLIALLTLASGSQLCAAETHRLPVPGVTIYPGTIIRDAWLVDREFSADLESMIANAIETRAGVVGKVARRTLLPGSPIASSSVAEPKIVLLGAKIRLLFEEDGLAITTYGTALQSGSAGDLISIRNLGSGLIISGTVQTDGSVRVGGN
ncbi:flagella basal body P-ring formation protein FlgA [Beijerinckiaceae bacterium]|nr:flagella basal body P-ring formation protein FlgA [Beijerinckiaceae bacterium]